MFVFHGQHSRYPSQYVQVCVWRRTWTEGVVVVFVLVVLVVLVVVVVVVVNIIVVVVANRRPLSSSWPL